MLNPIAPISGISNEILCILVAQETAKLPNVKVGVLKKILPLSPIRTCAAQVLVGHSFFRTSNFDLLINNPCSGNGNQGVILVAPLGAIGAQKS